jgi:hypothetical protein
MRTKYILWIAGVALFAGAAWYTVDNRERAAAESNGRSQLVTSDTEATEQAGSSDGRSLQDGHIGVGELDFAPADVAADQLPRATAGANILSDQEEIDRALTILEENPGLLGTDALDYAALLAEEKRDEPWASAVESGIASQIAGLQAVGGKGLQVPYVRCGSTVCEVRAVNHPGSLNSTNDWQDVAGRFSTGNFGPRLSHGTTTGMPASDKKRIVYITYLTR